MELLLVLIVGAFLILALYPSFKKNLQHTGVILDSEIESTWIDLKKDILVTCAYEKEAKYQRLYFRCKEVLSRILERHRHLILDIEARQYAKRPGMFAHHIGAQAMNALQPGSSFINIDSDTLFYMAFHSYLGGQTKSTAVIEANPEFLIRSVDYLISERNYPEALFLKGLILKYGVTVFAEPNLPGAKSFLTEAKLKGVGAAEVELVDIHRHSELAGIKSVQLGAERYAWN